MESFVNLLISVADNLYQFVIAFGNQIDNACRNAFPGEIYTSLVEIFWFLFIVNIIVIPVLLLFPKFARMKTKDHSNDKNSNKDKEN